MANDKHLLSHLALALFVLSPVLASGGNIYKCKDSSGRDVFTDKKCDFNAVPKRVWDSRIDNTVSSNNDDPKWCDDGAASMEAVHACLDLWRPSLRDPHAAYADGGVLVHNEKTNERAIFVDAYARNGFGGFNPMRMSCGLDEHGDVSSTASEGWMKLARAFATLHVEPSRLPTKSCPK